MNQTFKILMPVAFYCSYSFSMNHELLKNDLESSLVRSNSQEIMYPYRDNCCALCVRQIVADDDQNEEDLRPSELYRCLRIGCALCTGTVVISTTFVWFFMHQHKDNV